MTSSVKKKEVKKAVVAKNSSVATAKSLVTEKQAKNTKSKPASKKTTVTATQAAPKTPSVKSKKIVKKINSDSKQETKIEETKVKIEETKVVQKAQVDEVVRIEPVIEAPSILVPNAVPPTPYSLPVENLPENKKVNFENLIANEDIIKILRKLNYKSPSIIVQKSLPAILRGNDVTIQNSELSESFFLAAVSVASKIATDSISKGSPSKPSALFLVPNQKNANDTFTHEKNLFNELGLSVEEINENDSDSETKEKLHKAIDIVIATPKSIIQAIKHSSVNLHHVSLCFFSELNFASQNDDLDNIFTSLHSDKTQKVFTVSENSPFVRECTYKFLEDPEIISFLECEIKEKYPRHIAHALTATQKFQVLLGHLKTHKPPCAIVFTNTKKVAEWVAFKLYGNGFKVLIVPPNLNFRKRLELVKAVKSGDVNILVASDVGAKNLGLENLNCIYNFDLPDTSNLFLARLNKIVGAKKPIVVSFICEDYGYNMGPIEEFLGFKVHVSHPDRNYFNLKDTSEYPLESDGRVKTFPSLFEPVVAKETPKYVAQAPVVAAKSSDTVVTAKTPDSVVEEQIKVVAHKAHEVVHAEQAQPAQKLFQTRPKQQAPEEHTAAKSTHAEHHKPAHSDTQTRPSFSNERFVRRDDRAKEIIESAKQSAKFSAEKRKDKQVVSQAAAPQRPGLLKIMVSLVQDTVQSAAVAAKDTFASNLQENLPGVASILEKFNILKKPKEIRK